MRNTTTPSVNAGSMADIAFLLLIFFLVTSMIPNDKGIAHNLPQACPPGADCNIPIKKNNLLQLTVNKSGEILANENPTPIEDLKEEIKNFIDNNANKNCMYCKGQHRPEASDSPKKASLALAIHREAPYQSYIAVQDAIAKAYFELRESYVSKVLNREDRPHFRNGVKESTGRLPYPHH